MGRSTIQARYDAARRALGRLKGVRVHPDLDPIDALIVATYSTHTVIEQIALFDGTVRETALTVRRARLVRMGIISPVFRAKRSIISSRERTAVIRMYQSGLSKSDIAHTLNVAIGRVKNIIHDAQADGKRIQRQRTYTLRDVGRIFGSSSLAYRMVEHGWLVSSKMHRDGRYCVTMADIIDLVRVKAAWVAYTPAQIIDPHVRRAAELARQADPGRWVSHKELAHLWGYGSAGMSHLVAHGALDGYEETKWSSGRYVWVPAGWDLPRPRYGVYPRVPKRFSLGVNGSVR